MYGRNNKITTLAQLSMAFAHQLCLIHSAMVAYR